MNFQSRDTQNSLIADSIILQLSMIIVGAAVLGTLFLYARQPIIIAYIAVGILLGPSGIALVDDTALIEQISHLGIVLLLFLIGLNLQPNKLIGLFSETALLTLGTSVIFAGFGVAFALFIGLGMIAAVIFGAAMMFSSTVISLKLIPTTALHHKRMGEVMTSVLLLQDMIAILVILYVSGDQVSDNMLMDFGILAFSLVLLCAAAFAGVRFIMIPLLTRFDVVQEYTFLATLGWCLLWAETASLLGLSYEIGAFVAGLSIASCPIAIAIAEHLKPLREFFLILFFFAVGSNIDLGLDPALLFSAILFGVLVVPVKALVFERAFILGKETANTSKELAVRLAQSSEFALLVALSATTASLLTRNEVMVIQIATITSFIVSTYWVVLRYPTPIAENANLRRD